MAVICPTVTARDEHTYRTQVERVLGISKRIHIDLADGEFAPKSLELNKVWLPKHVSADIHLMYQNPENYVDELIKLEPAMVIVHAEADGKFPEIAKQLHDAGIKVGVAILAHTSVSMIEPSIEHIDHALIFSGKLGHFGGFADLDLLSKVDELRSLKVDLEIGWDGGINEDNAERLVSNGVDVLNVGGFIQRSSDPSGAYAKLNLIIEDK